MEGRVTLGVLALVSLICNLLVTVECKKSEEDRLVTELLTDYTKLGRPAERASDTVNVSVSYSLFSFNLEWRDPRLAWKPTDHGLVNSVALPSDQIWLPELASESGISVLGLQPVLVSVASDGKCQMEAPVSMVTTCNIDSTWYPYDAQVCEFTFGSWALAEKKLNLTITSEDVNLDSFMMNRDWTLISTKLKRNMFYYECCHDERYISISARITLARRLTMKYKTQTFLPPVLVSLVTMASFGLPVASGERILLGIFQLVSFGGIWMYTNLAIPSKTHVSVSDTFFGVMFFGCFLSFLGSILVVKVHYRRTKMPKAMKSLVGKFSRVLMCEKNVDTEIKEDSADMGHQKDWDLLSVLLDRIFLILFMVFFVISCIAIFVPSGPYF